MSKDKITIEDFLESLKFLSHDDFSDLDISGDHVRTIESFISNLQMDERRKEMHKRSEAFLKDLPNIKYFSGSLDNGYVLHALLPTDNLKQQTQKNIENIGSYDTYYGNVRLKCKEGLHFQPFRRARIARNEYDFTTVSQEVRKGFDGHNYNKVCPDCLKLVTKELLSV